jgi:glutathione S-transferase
VDVAQAIALRAVAWRARSDRMTLKLYDTARSTWNTRKVRLLAAELGLDVDRTILDFQKGDLRSDDYRAKNPNGKIPTIETDGLVLWESCAILVHLADAHPERKLCPVDPHVRARVFQWLFWWASHVEPALDTLLREKRIKPFLGQGGNDASIIADATSQLGRFLPILDAQLAENEFVVGPLTVVDVAMVAHLDTAPSLGVDLAPYAHVRAWLARMKARPSWASTAA